MAKKAKETDAYETMHVKAHLRTIYGDDGMKHNKDDVFLMEKNRATFMCGEGDIIPADEDEIPPPTVPEVPPPESTLKPEQLPVKPEVNPLKPEIKK